MANWVKEISPTLARAPRVELKRMLNLVRWEEFGLTRESARQLCEDGMAFTNGDELRKVEQLWMLWEQVLERKRDVDEVCRAPSYLSDAWASWAGYTRTRLREAFGVRFVDGGLLNAVPDPKVIVDLGNGLGLSTRALSEAYPEALVCGTNLEGSVQSAIAEANSMGRFGQFGDPIEVLAWISDNGFKRADIVVAMEYFEHFERPLQHLHAIMLTLRPRVLLVANSFKLGAVGHWPEYFIEGRGSVTPRQAGTAFWNALRDYGYERRESEVWNNRPAFWVKS